MTNVNEKTIIQTVIFISKPILANGANCKLGHPINEAKSTAKYLSASAIWLPIRADSIINNSFVDGGIWSLIERNWEIYKL